MVPGFVVNIPDANLEDFIEHVYSGTKQFAAWYCQEKSILWENQEPEADFHIMVGDVPGKGPVVTIENNRLGNTGYLWTAIKIESLNELFSLAVERFHSDKLHVVFIGQGGNQDQADRVLDWMKYRWKVLQRDSGKPEGSESTHASSPQLDTPRSIADQWLIKQYFDVYGERRKPGTFADDWLRIRSEQDGINIVPQNTGDSIRQVISKERKRRNMKNHE